MVDTTRPRRPEERIPYPPGGHVRRPRASSFENKLGYSSSSDGMKVHSNSYYRSRSNSPSSRSRTPTRKRRPIGPSCYSCLDDYGDRHCRERPGSRWHKHQHKKNQVDKYDNHEVDYDGYEESKLSDSGEPASGKRCGASELHASGRTCADDGENRTKKGEVDVSGSLATRLADLESRVLSPEGEAAGVCGFGDPAALFTAECDVKVCLSFKGRSALARVTCICLSAMRE